LHCGHTVAILSGMKSDTLVASREFKYRAGAYLERVQRGETFTITIHDKPVARVVPVAATLSVAQAVTDLRALRKGHKSGGNLRKWIHHGRR